MNKHGKTVRKSKRNVRGFEGETEDLAWEAAMKFLERPDVRLIDKDGNALDLKKMLEEAA